MLTTTVTNGTQNPLILKEGTAGMKRLLVTLGPHQCYTIKVDANATYREYWCAAKHDDPNAVILSSDDCQEFMKVLIKLKVEGNSDTYTWEGVRRDNGRKVEVNDGAKHDIPESAEDTSKGIWKRFIGFFRQGDS